MMDADITKLPTNMADEYVASYRFMQAVKSKSPMKDVETAKATKNPSKHHGMASPLLLVALTIVNESLRKFCRPVKDPPATPQAKRRKITDLEWHIIRASMRNHITTNPIKARKGGCW